jgi:hypothetical protein
VQHSAAYTGDRADAFQTYLFTPVSVTSLRIVCKVSKAAAGIVEWKLLRPEEVPAEEPTQPEPTPTTPTPSTPESPQSNASGKGFFDRFLDFWRMLIRWFRNLFS